MRCGEEGAPFEGYPNVQQGLWAITFKVSHSDSPSDSIAMLGKSLPRERCEKAWLKPEPDHVCSGPSDSVLKPSDWSYENTDEVEDVCVHRSRYFGTILQFISSYIYNISLFFELMRI